MSARNSKPDKEPAMTASEFPAVPAVVDAMKQEITDLIADGTVPANVATFADLHDYIDANMLAEDLFPEFPDTEDDDIVQNYMDASVEVLNPAQDAVDAWLRNGRQ
jgi:hypothetical protein